MIKNVEFISRMSLEEKVKFICTQTNKIQVVSDYGFPSYTFSENPIGSRKDVRCTIYPSPRAMGASLDYDLIKRCYRDMGAEAKKSTSHHIFKFDTSHTRSLFNEDQLLNGKCIASSCQGLKDVRMPYVFECNFVDKKSPQKTFDHNFTALEYALKNSTPYAIIVNSSDDIKYIKNTNYYNGPYIAKANTIEEAIKAYNSGACLVLFNEELENTESYLLDAITNYHKTYIKVKNGFVSKSSFNNQIATGKLLSYDVVNEAVDNLIELLSKFTHDFSYQVAETVKGLSDHTAYFDEVMHGQNAYNLAQSSVVLLKNENEALPLSANKKVGVFGESVVEKDYHLAEFENDPTTFTTIFDLINNYDIKTTGFSYGYKQDSDSEELITDAIEIAKSSDYSLVVLKNTSNSSKLPDNQINLVKTLGEKGYKVICVVESECEVDLSFDVYCEALVFTSNLGQYFANSVLDVLSGKYNPRGRLPFTISEANEVDVDTLGYSKYQFLSLNHIKTKYPFAYSLSYSTFDIKLLECKDDGISLSIKNDSNYDGFANLGVYISQNSKNPLEFKSLKHITSYYLKAKESQRFEIKFDEYTFRNYDSLISTYLIRGGKYVVSVENGCDLPICGVALELKQNILSDIDKWDDIKALNENDFSFVEEAPSKEIENRKTKKVLSIVGLVYIDLLCVYLAFYGVINNLMMITLISVIVLAVATILFLKMIFKYKKPAESRKMVKEITDSVDKMNNFYEVAKVVYKEPVHESINDTDFTYIKEEVVEEAPQEEKDENIIPEAEVVEEVEEESAPTEFDEKFERYESHVITHVDAINEMYLGFVSYLETKGLVIEKRLAREIFASIYSSNLIVLNPTDEQLAVKLCEYLIEYLSLDSGLTDFDNAELDDFSLCWKVNEETNKYVKRTLIDDTYKASVAPDSLFISCCHNINPSNFKEAFNSYLRFVTSPKMDTYIKLTDERIKINKNLVVILISQDRSLNNLCDQQINIQCNIGVTEASVSSVEVKEISYTQIQEQKFEILEKYTILEDKWKAFDDLEEYVSKIEKFKIGNKKTLLMENYIACYLSQSDSEYEAIDSCLGALLSNKISRLNLLNNAESRGQFIETIDRLFTDEGTRKLKEYLK